MILSLNILINVVILNKSVLLLIILAHNISCIHKMKELYHSAERQQHYFDMLKDCFIRHSSENKTSDCD